MSCNWRIFIRVFVILTTYLNEFQSSNEEHIRLLKDMGIAVVTLSDGRIQLVHNYLTVSLYKLNYYLIE